ncbi:MAG: hypothetical protein M3Z31_13475 [Pseudomonadota bacterium]|nr:hypothetical protein [Pseudomonadota bacterium]
MSRRLARSGATQLAPSDPALGARAGIRVATALALFALADTTFAQASPAAPETRQRETPLAPASNAPPTTGSGSGWAAAEPWRTDRFYLETSAYTRHFHDDPAHVERQQLILGEYNVTEQWLVGASVFKNSFGQASQYVYGGYRFRPFERLQPLYFKVSAGLVHGYSGQYRDKIPLNRWGIAPVAVPSVGYCFNRFCSELVLFGNAGALITVGVTLP